MTTIYIPTEIRSQFKSFSQIERESLYQLMCSVMIVDRDADPRELQVINEISQAMGLTQSEIVASRKLTRETIFSALRRMPDMKRFLVAKTISTIAMADGKVLPIEDAFAVHLAKELDLDSSWF